MSGPLSNNLATSWYSGLSNLGGLLKSFSGGESESQRQDGQEAKNGFISSSLYVASRTSQYISSSSLSQKATSNVDTSDSIFSTKKVEIDTESLLKKTIIGVGSYALGMATGKISCKDKHIEVAHTRIRSAVADSREYIQFTQLAIPNLVSLVFNASGLDSKEIGGLLFHKAAEYIPDCIKKPLHWFSQYIPAIIPEIAKSSGFDPNSIDEVLLQNKENLHDLLEVNLAIGFANLAEQTAKYKSQIPHYDEQSTLVNIISLLNQKIQTLPSLENFRKDKTEEQLAPYPQGYEMEVTSALMVDEILKLMFPGKLNDLNLAGVLIVTRFGPIQDLIFSSIELRLKNSIVEIRRSLILDPVRKRGYEISIEAKIPEKLKQLVKLPSAALKGFLTHFIHTDPRCVGWVSSTLNQFASHPKDKSSEMMSKLTLDHLAGWVVTSVQSLLNSDDPSLLNTGQILDEVLNNIALVLLAKGMEKVTADELPDRGDQTLFIRNLIDQLIGKFKVILSGERAVYPKTIRRIIKELPIPGFAKEKIAVLTIANLKQLEGKLRGPRPLQNRLKHSLQNSLNGKLNARKPNILKLLKKHGFFKNRKKIKRVSPLPANLISFHATAMSKIKKYKNSQELIAISKNISTLIAKNTQKVKEVIPLHKLMEKYLPGVEFDQSLALWMKENLEMLSAGGAGVQLIQNGIQSVILTGIDQTIRANFKANSEDYAAQLLGRFNDVFLAFQNLSMVEQQELREAHIIQWQIDIHERRITQLKRGVEKRPKSLPEEADALFKIKHKELEAINHVRNLKQKQKALFVIINKQSKKYIWRAANLKFAEEALAYYFANKDFLEIEKKRLQKTDAGVLSALRLSADQRTQKNAEVKEVETLIDLMRMGPDALNLFSQVLNINHTLKQAIKDRNYHAAQVAAFPAMRLKAHQRKYVNNYLGSIKKINESSAEVERLNRQLNINGLEIFKRLSNSLMEMFGLDDAFWQSRNLTLPEAVKNLAMDNIEYARRDILPLFLFKQLSGLLKPLLAKAGYRQKLNLASGTDSWSGLASAIAKGAIVKIQENATDFKGIAKQISDMIPGSTDLHMLLAPQFEQIINSDIDVFVHSRQLLSEYIECALLKYFASIADSNADQSITQRIRAHFSHITIYPAEIIDKTPKQIEKYENCLAKKAVDEIMGDVFHLSLPADLNGIPPMIQQYAFDLIRKEAYKQVSALLKPIIEREMNREKLYVLSGTRAMVSLAEQMSEDICKLPSDRLAAFIPSYLDAELKTQITSTLQTVTQNGGQRYKDIAIILGPYFEGMILRLFIRISEKNRAVINAQGLIEKDTVLVIYDKLIDLVSRHAMQIYHNRMTYDLLAALNKEILEEVLNIPLDSDEALDGIPLPIQKLVHEEITEQIGSLAMMLNSYLTKLENSDPKVIELKKELKKIAENKSKEACAVVASADLGRMVGPKMLILLSEVLGKDFTYGTTLVSNALMITLKEYEKSNFTLATVLLNYTRTDDLMRRLDANITGLVGNKEVNEIVALIVGNGLLAPMSSLLTKIKEFEDKKGEQFNRNLMTGVITTIAQHLEYRQMAKKDGLVTHAGFVKAAGANIHPALPDKAISFDETTTEITRRLKRNIECEERAKLIKVITGLTDDEYLGIRNFKIEDLIIGLKKEGVKFTRSEISRICNLDDRSVRLEDLIRKEAVQLIQQRVDHSYLQLTKDVMHLAFPKETDDLDFIPPQLREVVWKQLRTNLLPIAMKSAVEILFEETEMTSIILKSLEKLKATFSEPVTTSEPVETNPELAIAGGRLLRAFMSELNLPYAPELVKNLVVKVANWLGGPNRVDNLTGNLLTGIFNKIFIQETLKSALEVAASRDEKGQPTLQADLRTVKQVADEKSATLKKMNAEIKKITRQVMDEGFSYAIRSIHQTIRSTILKMVKRVAGQYGEAFIDACLKVIDFILIKVLLTVLLVILNPFILLGKEMLYKYIKLDKNLDNVIDMLTYKPIDQPENAPHPIYYEHLVYKIADVIRTTVQDSGFT